MCVAVRTMVWVTFHWLLFFPLCRHIIAETSNGGIHDCVQDFRSKPSHLLQCLAKFSGFHYCERTFLYRHDSCHSFHQFIIDGVDINSSGLTIQCPTNVTLIYP